jgi:hypothetical protein
VRKGVATSEAQFYGACLMAEQREHEASLGRASCACKDGPTKRASATVGLWPGWMAAGDC